MEGGANRHLQQPQPVRATFRVNPETADWLWNFAMSDGYEAGGSLFASDMSFHKAGPRSKMWVQEQAVHPYSRMSFPDMLVRSMSFVGASHSGQRISTQALS
jgi:hypothetical protein